MNLPDWKTALMFFGGVILSNVVDEHLKSRMLYGDARDMLSNVLGKVIGFLPAKKIGTSNYGIEILR